MADRRIFISYSHADELWMRRLVEALAPWVHRGDVDLWADTQIAVGADWRRDIDEHLEAATVGVVLVSAALLASTFVIEEELPALLRATQQGRLTLVWFSISAAGWDVTPLADFQAARDPRRPLDLLERAEAQDALVDVARKIAGARSLTDLSRSMGIVDELSVETEGRGHRVQARNTGTQLQFDERDVAAPIATITYTELADLPSGDFALIASMQELMENEYERWLTLRKKQTVLTAAEREELATAGQRMCAELRNILDFIEYTMHKYLADHYNGIRYSCERLVSQG